MKIKTLFTGTLYYLGMFIILIGMVIVDGMLVPQPVPTRYLITIIISALFCGALYFRIREKASFVHAILALIILLAALISLGVTYRVATGLEDCLIPTLFFIFCGLICGLGFVFSKYLLIKWNTKKDRRRIARLSPLPVLISCLLLFFYDKASYLQAARNSQQLDAPALTANADELMKTKITPELDAPIIDGTNLIWCATFQTAWNEMIHLVGEDIRLAENEPESVARLNQRQIDASQLDPDTFLSFAGPYSRKFINTANEALDKKFGRGTFEPHAPPLADNPDQLAVFAFLSANLPFKHAFERSESGMTFEGVWVESFTIPFSDELRTHARKAKRQVLVQYPPEDEAFMVELVSLKRDHHLILAKIAPEATLSTTIKKAIDYADTLPRNSMETNQHLAVPLFNFDVTKSYDELTNKKLALKNPDFNQGFIRCAKQSIRFQLDERGAAVKSNAFVAIAKCLPPMDCVFNEPFLLLLRYRDSELPYFAMWIDNAEILVKKTGR